MSHYQQIIRHLFSLSAAEMVARVCGLLLTIYIARVLGVSVFGQLSFALAYTSYFNLFGEFGLSALGIREISQDPSKTSILGSNIFFLQVSLSVGLFALLLLSLPFLPLPIDGKWLVLLYGLSIFPQAINMAYLLNAHQKLHQVALLRVITQLGSVMIGFSLLAVFHNILILPIIQFLTLSVGAVASLGLIRKQLGYTFSRPSLAQARWVIWAALPFILSAVAVQIYSNLDSIILQFIRDEQSVGWYTAAYRIISQIITVGGLLAVVLYPALSKAYAQGAKQFSQLLSFLALLTGVMIFPITIGGILVAKPLILTLYGQEYVPAIQPFAILLAMIPVVFLNSILGYSLIAGGRIWWSTAAGIVGAVANILANLLLIPRYGLVGAATATLLAELAVSIGYIVISLRLQPKLYSVRQVAAKYTLQPLSCSLVMGVVVWLGIRWGVPLMGLVIMGGIVYVGCLAGLKVVDLTAIKNGTLFRVSDE